MSLHLAPRLPTITIQNEVWSSTVPPEQYEFTFPGQLTHAHFFCSKVYADGNVCISILHTPGDDPTMYEQASERWSPVQSVEKVILSVISMLAGAIDVIYFYWTLIN